MVLALMGLTVTHTIQTRPTSMAIRDITRNLLIIRIIRGSLRPLMGVTATNTLPAIRTPHTARQIRISSTATPTLLMQSALRIMTVLIRQEILIELTAELITQTINKILMGPTKTFIIKARLFTLMRQTRSNSITAMGITKELRVPRIPYRLYMNHHTAIDTLPMRLSDRMEMAIRMIRAPIRATLLNSNQLMI